MYSVHVSQIDNRKQTETETSLRSGGSVKNAICSEGSHFRDGPFPTVLTDHLNRVLETNRLFESSTEQNSEEIRGQNLLSLIARLNSKLPQTPTATQDQSVGKGQDRSWTLELVEVTDEMLVWRLIQSRTGASLDIRGESFIRVDPAENSDAETKGRIINPLQRTSSREEIIANLGQERLDSMIPRLTSLFGHLDFVKLSADKVEMSHRRPSEDKISHSISVAKQESEQILEIVQELRGLRQLVHAHQKNHNLRSLIDRCLRLLVTELDAQAIELHCSNRMRDESVNVLTDGVTVCQAILWLVRRTATDLSRKDRQIFADCLMEDQQLKLGVSFIQQSRSMDQSTSTSGSLNLQSRNIATDVANEKVGQPSVAPVWHQVNRPNGKTTITVSVPCIKGLS